jgi:hypothetical protein
MADSSRLFWRQVMGKTLMALHERVALILQPVPEAPRPVLTALDKKGDAREGGLDPREGVGLFHPRRMRPSPCAG